MKRTDGRSSVVGMGISLSGGKSSLTYTRRKVSSFDTPQEELPSPPYPTELCRTYDKVLYKVCGAAACLSALVTAGSAVAHGWQLPEACEASREICARSLDAAAGQRQKEVGAVSQARMACLRSRPQW